MSVLSVRLPESLHRTAREVAAQDGVPINQLISSASGEKIAALKTAEFLREQGQGANENDLAQVLALVPNVEPESRDYLPN